MKQLLLGLVLGGSITAGSIFLFLRFSPSHDMVISPFVETIQRPLDRYAIEELGKRGGKVSQIQLDEAVATTSAYTAYNFSFESEGKRVTGRVNIPTGSGPFPTVVQFRGYVDRDVYITGEGTRRSGEYFASRGFISIAPDFLGYGGSDMPSQEIFEERFQTYIVALDMISSVSSLPQVDTRRIALWGHSNGGHIALTVLEALQASYPLTLWAPVTKQFPYSVLYYTDELGDGGKYLRKELAKFESLYDTDKYSLVAHINRLMSPVLFHQGSADEAVPQKWSDEFVERLRDAEKDVTYYVYNGADHNMLGAWDSVVARDVAFFEEMFEKTER